MIVLFKIFCVVYPTVAIMTLGIFGVMYCVSSKGLSKGEKTTFWALMTFGISVLYNVLNKVYVNNCWSDPWKKHKNNNHGNSDIMRYNSYTKKFQIWERNNFEKSKWIDIEHVYGDPMEVYFTDFRSQRQKINPYDVFQNPLKPTKEEIALFHVDYNVDYNMIKKNVTKILKGQFK